MLKEIKHEFEINGVKCSFATGKIAPRSQAAVYAQMGDTIVLATVNRGAPRGDADFFPMSVEYIEKMYAAGKISGSRFVKRDRFPSDDAILKARVIDRSFRPRFPSDYRDELQVIVKVLSFDKDYDPLILGINAVSAAMMISPAPFYEAVSGVRVGDNESGLYAFNSHVDRDDIEVSKLDLIIAGDGQTLTNIDSNAYEISEDRYIEAMEFGLELMKPWIDAQMAFVEMVGSVEKIEYESFALPEELIEEVTSKYGDEIGGNIMLKTWRAAKVATMEKMNEELQGQYSKRQMDEVYEYAAKKELRKLILSGSTRADGRELDEIRELASEIDLLPRVHGSGLFTRGKTQVLSVATLGSIRNQMQVDDMTGEDVRRYMHYYVEGPYAFGEAGRYKHIPGRREVGHGALAEKALYPVLPSVEEFPYTIMLMSEIMAEMGSSSMASTCGSTLALMAAGVPIKKPVAGIAMGVIPNDDMSEYKIITDLKDIEDFYGGMDFKVTGTRDGVTAIQMDTKLSGVPIDVFKDAIAKAKIGRMAILDVMEDAIAKPSEKLSEFAPRVHVIKIPERKIGELIGPGGKNIKRIVEETTAELNVEDDGTVQIFANDDKSLEAAKELVLGYAFEPEVGKVYAGTVVKVVEFGAFVRIGGSTEGLLHVSEISDTFIKDVNEHIKEGDKVEVKVLAVDNFGKIKLSKKAVEAGKKAE